MMTDAANDNERIAHEQDPDDLDGDYLGRDVDGHTHYWHMGRQRITVRDARDQLVHRASLADRPLSDWIAFVDDAVGGWTDLSGYSETPLVAMVEVDDA